jgi:predicted nucleic acid-binding protein
VTSPFVDTDVIIRLLSGDDLIKQAKAFALFEQVAQGVITLAAPDTVIADAVFVLSSPRLYNLPRHEVAALLTPLVQLPHFRVKNGHTILAALALYGYGPVKLDFGDAMLVASMQQSNSQTLYSFDTDFDKIPGIRRQEP